MKKFLILLSIPLLLTACGKSDENNDTAVDPQEEQILAFMVDVTCMYAEGGELKLTELYEKHGFGEMTREEVDEIYEKHRLNIKDRLEAQTKSCIAGYLESQTTVEPDSL